MIKYSKGKIVKGTVSGIEKYGIFVKLDEYYSGLIHISEISDGFVRNVEDYVNIGDVIYVEILDIDEEMLHMKLSIKNILYKYGSKSKKRKIVETDKGFSTLEEKLPIWIEENLKNHKKAIK